MRKFLTLFLILCTGLLSACQAAGSPSASLPASKGQGADQGGISAASTASTAFHPFAASAASHTAEAAEAQQEPPESYEMVVYTNGLPTAVEPGSRQAEEIMQAVTALCKGTGQIVPLAMPEAPAGQEAAGPIEEAKNASALEISYGQDITLSFHLEQTEGSVQSEPLTFEKILIAPEQQLVFLYADGSYRDGPIRFYTEEDFAAVRELLQNP